MTPIMLQNGFLCVHVLLLDDRVCVDRRSKEAHIQASNKPCLRIIMTQRYNDTERQASILVLPYAAEIDGCIQDFYTPLIGFTGH